MKNLKKLHIFWCITLLVFGLILGFVLAALQLTPRQKTIVIVIYYIFMMLSLYYLNHRWYRRFTKEVSDLTPILFEENDPERYIRENNILFQGKRSAQLLAIYNMNLFLAYFYKEDFTTAKTYLLQVQEKKVHGILKIVYYINLIHVNFCLGETATALTLFEKHKQKLLKFKTFQELGSSIDIIEAFVALTQGDAEMSREICSQSKKNWMCDSNIKEYAFLEKQISLTPMKK